MMMMMMMMMMMFKIIRHTSQISEDGWRIDQLNRIKRNRDASPHNSGNKLSGCLEMNFLSATDRLL